MFRDQDLADASLIINSVDPCISCMERTALVAPGGDLRGVLDGQRLLEMSRDKSRKMLAGGTGR
jgi:membrane-bound hydrogenase subunit alpha